MVTALRQWRWAYPALNGAHILGLALLFGAILPLDLRIAGLWRSVPLAPLARVLRPVAAAGLTVSLLTGPLLFLVDPARYAGLTLFWAKLALILAAIVNLALVERALRPLLRYPAGNGPAIPAPLRLGAAVSVALWLAVILCGRFIAYV